MPNHLDPADLTADPVLTAPERWAVRRVPKVGKPELPWVLMRRNPGGYWQDYAACRHEWQAWVLCDVLDDADRNGLDAAWPPPDPDLLIRLRRWLSDDDGEAASPAELLASALRELERLAGQRVLDEPDHEGRNPQHAAPQQLDADRTQADSSG